MNPNAMAITIFCSSLCEPPNAKTLTPAEWSWLAAQLRKQGLEPEALLNFSEGDFHKRLGMDDAQTQRLLRLLDRSGSLTFEINKYENRGIQILTRADEHYPKQLKEKLRGSGCPPLFYYAGDLSLLNKKAVGYVGSRHIDEEDADFARLTLHKTLDNGFCTVSGGARGIDTVAESETIQKGGESIVYLADSMMRRIKNPDVLRAIQDQQLLLLSVVRPTAGFSVGSAMMRNRYIYAQSVGTVVIRSDLGKGGTWSGATENIKNAWCETFCWQNESYAGNMELIRWGATPITKDWDGKINPGEWEARMQDKHQQAAKEKTKETVAEADQLSLFD